MAIHRFKKGEKKPPNSGRKKGTPNKFTTLKQAFINAFNSEAMGGEKGMTEVFAATNFTKREFYKLISKMLPSDVRIDGEVKITHQISDKFFPKLDKKKSE